MRSTDTVSNDSSALAPYETYVQQRGGNAHQRGALTHALHVLAVRSLTTGPREDGALLPQDRSPMAEWLLCQTWQKKKLPLALSIATCSPLPIDALPIDAHQGKGIVRAQTLLTPLLWVGLVGTRNSCRLQSLIHGGCHGGGLGALAHWHARLPSFRVLHP